MRLLCSLFAVCAILSMTGCVVAGYSSRGGFFLWPGSIVLTLLGLLVFYLMRRR